MPWRQSPCCRGTGDELCDFELAVSQADKGRGPAGCAGLDVHPIKVDILDCLALEYAFAVHDLRQCRRNGGDIGLDQVAAGAQFERRHNVLVIRECRQKHHARRRVALKDLACRRKSVTPRHLNVEQCDIGRVFGIERNRIVAVGTGAHHFDLRLAPRIILSESTTKRSSSTTMSLIGSHLLAVWERWQTRASRRRWHAGRR